MLGKSTGSLVLIVLISSSNPLLGQAHPPGEVSVQDRSIPGRKAIDRGRAVGIEKSGNTPERLSSVTESNPFEENSTLSGTQTQPSAQLFLNRTLTYGELNVGLLLEARKHGPEPLTRNNMMSASSILFYRVPVMADPSGSVQAREISSSRKFPLRKERPSAFPQVGGRVLTISSPIVLFFAALGAGVAVGVVLAEAISPGAGRPGRH
jgi:hypothetical protein